MKKIIQMSFPGRDDFTYEIGQKRSSEIPPWAFFDAIPCPGNELHGPDISYCRLACDLVTIVDYFKDIKSFETGTLIFHESSSKEFRFTGDGQNIFFYVFWILLLHTDCSVFKHDKRIRRHYAIASDFHTVLYTLFSIYLVSQYFKKPEEAISLDGFSVYLGLVSQVLESLLQRINVATKDSADSCSNGIVIFESILELFRLNDKEMIELMILNSSL